MRVEPSLVRPRIDPSDVTPGTRPVVPRARNPGRRFAAAPLRCALGYGELALQATERIGPAVSSRCPDCSTRESGGEDELRVVTPSPGARPSPPSPLPEQEIRGEGGQNVGRARSGITDSNMLLGCQLDHAPYSPLFFPLPEQEIRGRAWVGARCGANDRNMSLKVSAARNRAASRW